MTQSSGSSDHICPAIRVFVSDNQPARNESGAGRIELSRKPKVKCNEMKCNKTKRIIAACIAGVLGLLVANFACAQTAFPARIVKIIVPFPGDRKSVV